jgi:hypothetical protein
MKFEKKYKFETWNDWNDIISNSSQDFFNHFGCYPGILEANCHTFSQIDFICNINKEHGENVYEVDEKTGEKEYLLLSGKEVSVNIFKCDNYEIAFAFDEKLEDKEFILTYDDEPDDDDDIPVVDLPVEMAEV